MSWSEVWSYDFMRNALISATILGPTCALLGVFVTLRGMSFFSDALAHSAVTGIALGFLLEERFGWSIDPMVVVFIFTTVLGLIMAKLSQGDLLRPDTIIAFTFSGSVALGVVIIAMLGKYRLLDGILFGSIYANDARSITYQVLLALVVFGFIGFNLRRLTQMTLNTELARIQGTRTLLLHYAFTLLVSATVVVSLKMLGALLLGALIVVPAAVGKVVAQSFRSMLLIALICGFIAPWNGVWASVQFDLPTGPSIVLSAILLLIFAYIWQGLITKIIPKWPASAGSNDPRRKHL
ncbi:MAG: metal ABC transporter permease [Verrucomicrobiota bacterium]